MFSKLLNKLFPKKRKEKTDLVGSFSEVCGVGPSKEVDWISYAPRPAANNPRFEGFPRVANVTSYRPIVSNTTGDYVSDLSLSNALLLGAIIGNAVHESQPRDTPVDVSQPISHEVTPVSSYEPPTASYEAPAQSYEPPAASYDSGFSSSSFDIGSSSSVDVSSSSFSGGSDF